MPVNRHVPADWHVPALMGGLFALDDRAERLDRSRAFPVRDGGLTLAQLVDETEGHVYVDDLDIPLNKMTEAVWRIVDRAVEESRRREHALLTSTHVLYALAQAEWDLFAQAMRGAEVNPNEVLRAIDEHLRRVPAFAGCEVRASSTAKLVCKLALHHAARAGHPGVEATDPAAGAVRRDAWCTRLDLATAWRRTRRARLAARDSSP